MFKIKVSFNGLNKFGQRDKGGKLCKLPVKLSGDAAAAGAGSVSF